MIDEVRKLAPGKPIRYVGVIGPVQFDAYGDITGPFRLWRIQKGEVTTTGTAAHPFLFAAIHLKNR